MAAALLAALFAMGVFAPAGLDARVESNDPAPKAVLVIGDDETTIPAAGTGTTLKVTFQVDDMVDSSGGDNDDVVVRVPAGLITGVGATGDTAVTADTTPALGSSTFSGKVTVTQPLGEDGAAKNVGDATAVWDSNRGLEITIAPDTAADPMHVKAGELVTLMVEDLRIAQMNEMYAIVIDQGNSRARAMTPRLFAMSGESAVLSADGATLTVKFTSTLGGGDDDTSPDAVTVTLPFEDTNVTATSATVGTPTAADGETTIAFTALTGIDLTVDPPVTKTEVTVTVATATEAEDGQEITIMQGSQTLTAVVGELPENPITVAGTTEGGKISSVNAGADNVRLEINAEVSAEDTDTASEVSPGEDITIDLKGFRLPDSADVDERDVIISGGSEVVGADSLTEYNGYPDSITISGSKVTLTLPAVNSQGGVVGGLNNGAYKITFKSSFGLGNPLYAGANTITVMDGDDPDERKTVTTVSTAKLDPTFVTRGGETTLTVKGIPDGTTTVHLGKSGPQLGSGSAADGVVKIVIVASHDDLEAASTKGIGRDPDKGTNGLYIKDANAALVKGAGGTELMVLLGIKPTVKLGSGTAELSGELKISVSDWYYGDIQSITIGGVEVEETKGTKEITVPSDTMKKNDITVTVPSDVRTGEQKVVVTGDVDRKTKSASATVTIEALALEVAPALVVPGQQITITGSGFPDSTDVSSIKVGGKSVDVPTDADSTSSGRVAVTIPVPANVGDGDHKVNLTVGSRMGVGTITVPEPSIELNPSTSVPGSVITVTGSGFDSSGRVEVEYKGKVEEVGRADGGGDFHIRLTIPSTAGVGATNDVKVLSRTEVDGVRVDISDTAKHTTPGPAITLPETAQVGTMVTISGSNFEPFTTLTVMIGGKDATPSGAETDKNGSFEIEARVPRISAGSHTVTVMDGSTDENSATETFTVVTTPVVSTPEEVFGVLGDKLVSVWSLDNATKKWSAYFPGAPEGVSDLTGVSRGDIVWINVNADVAFQGGMLTTGWNLISLE